MNRISYAAIALGLVPAVALAQNGAKDVMDQAGAYHAYVEAERNKSTLCRSYEGTTIAAVPIETLVGRLAGAGDKGEYETTAQYQIRKDAAAARLPSKPIAIAVPLDREYVRYDADIGAFSVVPRAFSDGQFSKATQVQLASQIVAIGAKDVVGDEARLDVGLSTTERTTSVGVAGNAFGATVRVAEVVRTSTGLSLRGGKLFALAPDDRTPVAYIGATPARAPALKAGLRAALIVEPEKPYVRTGTLRGAAATIRSPVHYTERSTILFARPLCALVLDARSKVLASVDAGAGSAR